MTAMPMTIATRVVDQKNPNAMAPSLPSRRGSPRRMTPVKTVVATRGTTTIRSRLTNAVPSGSIPTANARSPGDWLADATRPKANPRTSPTAIASVLGTIDILPGAPRL